jgi:hypothetical protein
MVLSVEKKDYIARLLEGNIVKEKFIGIKAIKEIIKIFFPDDKKEGDKFENRWTDDEKKNAVYVRYFLKKRKSYDEIAQIIIGEGDRRVVLGQRNLNKPKTKAKTLSRKRKKTKAKSKTKTKTNSKVGEPCKKSADCNNNNCVGKVCTRKNAKIVSKKKTKNKNS